MKKARQAFHSKNTILVMFHEKAVGLADEAIVKLIAELGARKLTLSFAESCTGGRLSAAFAEVPGVSRVFLGSVVAYANDVKMNLLGVRRSTLEKEGAVSEAVAYQMAHGVRRQLKTDWAVAITGIAGPDGGTVEKPVGTVWLAWVGPGVEWAELSQFSGERVAIQKAAVEHAVRRLAEKQIKN